MLNVNRPELARLQLDPVNPATWAINAIQYLSTPYNRAYEAYVSFDPRDEQIKEINRFKINGVYRFRDASRPQTVGFVDNSLQITEGWIRPHIKLYDGLSEEAAQELEHMIGRYDYRVEIPVLGPMADISILTEPGIPSKREPKFLERKDLLKEVLGAEYTGMAIRMMGVDPRWNLIDRCCDYLSTI